MGWSQSTHQCHCGGSCFQQRLREYMCPHISCYNTVACLSTGRWHLCFLPSKLVRPGLLQPRQNDGNGSRWLQRLGHIKNVAFPWRWLGCLPLEPSYLSVKKIKQGDACVGRSWAPGLQPASPPRPASERGFRSLQPSGLQTLWSRDGLWLLNLIWIPDSPKTWAWQMVILQCWVSG